MIEVHDVDWEPHTQSMNAVAGDNPEAISITEVTWGEPEQAAQSSPVRVGHSQGRSQVRLPALIKGLP